MTARAVARQRSPSVSKRILKPNRGDARRPSVPESLDDTDTKAELQRRMEAARESIAHTVEEIKDTVEDQYASVRETVTDMLDWKEQLQKDPLLWSVGALSAGFALGYTLGVAHKRKPPAGRARSGIALFADSLVDELSRLGTNVPMPALDERMKQTFGFELSDVLREIGGGKRPRHKTRSPTKKRAHRKTSRA